MSIPFQNFMQRIFNIGRKQNPTHQELPLSARLKTIKSNEARQFTIDRDVQGTRPWHRYTAK